MKIDPSHVKDGKFVDPAEVALKLLKQQRATIARGHTKNQKKISKASIERRDCHTRKCEDAKHQDLKHEIKKNNLPNERHFGLGALHDIVADPDLGVGKVALRRIPCACDSCREQQKKKWISGTDPTDQPRCTRNENCECWPIFEGSNDCEIVGPETKIDTDEDEIEETKEEVLAGIASCMSMAISHGEHGAIITEDENAHGCHLC